MSVPRVVCPAVPDVFRVARCAVAALATAALVAACAPAAEAAGVQAGPRELLGPRTPLTAVPGPGGWLRVSTAPARRAAGSIGINLDTWSNTGAYTPERWPNLVAALSGSGIGRARVDIHIIGRQTGTERQVQLGQAGVKLDVILGDAFGRYSTTPFSSVFDVFRSKLMPYAESVEGTNEPDLAGRSDWAAVSRAHQQQIVDALAATPGADRLAVFAPATGRPNTQGALGSMVGLADYANAHAYSGGRYGSLGFDSFVPPAQALLPSGAAVVTETGVHTGPAGGHYNQPGVPESVQARYAPMGLLEALRRGIPRTYLFDLVDRFDDPGNASAAAHFGLLRVDGSRKPAYGSVSRLMAELRDPHGNAAASTPPIGVRARPALPGDVRIVALRHADGSTILALWRERSLWDPVAQTPLPVPVAKVHLDLSEQYAVARVRTLASARTSWQLPLLGGLDLTLGDDVTVVRLSTRLD